MEFEKIILSIPHSVPASNFDKWKEWCRSAVRKEHDKWTDWHTDTIFGNLSEGNKGKVEAVIFNRSRYEVDVERLVGDPMEKIGQGIVYTGLKEGGDGLREVTDSDRVDCTRAYMGHWMEVASLCHGNGILIDCHSFPTDYSGSPNAEGEQVDVCIGFNDDMSNPGEDVINVIKSRFEEAGYTVGINSPFSNSFSPIPGFPSVMIELRKGIYMDEGTLKLLSSAYKVNQLLNGIYSELQI